MVWLIGRDMPSFIAKPQDLAYMHVTTLKDMSVNKSLENVAEFNYGMDTNASEF